MLVDIFDVQRVRVSNIVAEVAKAILTLENEFLGFPSSDKCLQNALKFFDIAEFPSVVACVDGTHVEFHPPREINAGYINRHHRKSLNIAVATGMYTA